MAIVAISLFGGGWAWGQSPYYVTDLGTTAGYVYFGAMAISDNALIAVNATTSDATGNMQHAFLYSNGTMTDLGMAPGFVESYATGVNSGGQVAGEIINPNLGVTHAYGAFLYASGAMAYLGTLGGNWSYATGINDSGQVVGWADTSATQHAFLYSNGTMTDLGALPGGSSWSGASAINAAGQVVGYSTISSGYEHAFLYSNGTMTDLGALPGGGSSIPSAINAGGQVAGFAVTSGGANHAFLYTNGTIKDLGTLPGFDGSDAMGINANGLVVGWNYITATDVDHAFLYASGTMVDLNTLIRPASGWTLEEASAINDSGQIVGWGSDNGTDHRAFLLTPAVPGDANLDGRVDVNDLTIVLTSFGKTTGTSWSTGDFNGDGKVDVNDLTAVLLNYGRSAGSSAAGPAAVPEPSAVVLLGMGALSLLGALVGCLKRTTVDR